MPDRRLAPGLHTVLAVLGVAATALASTAVIAAVALHVGPLDAVAACRGYLTSHVSPAWALVLALAVLVATVAIRAVRATRTRLHACRALRHALAELPVRDVQGQRVRVLAGPRPAAFCAGLLRPQLCVSTGALSQLRSDELRAVLAHERHHAQRRDPLRRMCADVLADALFFLPVLRPLAERRTTLAELRADEAAIAACGGDARALAAALLTFEENGSTAAGAVEAERVEHLAGTPAAWMPPLMPLLAALATLATLLALPVLAVERTTGTSLALDAFGVPICLAILLATPFALAAAVATRASRTHAGKVAT